MTNHQTDEQQLRRDLAAAYRISGRLGWMDAVFNHLSVRLPIVEGEKPTYLINPEGLMAEEMTPGALIKVDIDGTILDQPDATFIPAGFNIHTAVHTAREDGVCVMHNHAMAGMVVSVMKQGLMPLTQISMQFYNRVAYHDFGGIVLDPNVRDKIVSDFGNHKAMIMRNHGLMTVGDSIAEAFYYMYYLHESCQIQMHTLAACPDPDIPSHEVCEYTANQYGQFHEKDVRDLWNAMVRKLDREDPGWDAS